LSAAGIGKIAPHAVFDAGFSGEDPQKILVDQRIPFTWSQQSSFPGSLFSLKDQKIKLFNLYTPASMRVRDAYGPFTGR